MRHGALSNFLFRWGPAIFFMAAIFIFSSIPAEEVPNLGKFDLSAKKGAHILGYALLNIAYLHALGQRRPGARWLAWALTILYATTDEIHQSFTPGRNAWIVDIGIDSAGGLIGLAAAAILQTRAQKQPRRPNHQQAGYQ